jgi:hypothetical protein
MWIYISYFTTFNTRWAEWAYIDIYVDVW